MKSMLQVLSRRPRGKVSDVFRRPADLQAAYDFLEHATIDVAAVQKVAARDTALRCREAASIFVVLDGSSLSLTDREETKDFGSVGNRMRGARGLKVLNALAVTPDGRTVGVLAQRFWARGKAAKKGYRPLRERESYRWHEAFDRAVETMRECAPNTRLHVLADREGDASYLMRHVAKSGCAFTIRANGTRKARVGNRRVLLRPLLRKQPVLARYSIDCPDKPGSPARTARLWVRAAHLRMVVRDHNVPDRPTMNLTVVWAREENAPHGVKAVDWLLYTTEAVPDAASALQTVKNYAYRWRIEEFHKMLKSGGGCVEDCQLRSQAAVIKWATFHAMIASRAERLRDAARMKPHEPATTELSDAEIEALVLLKTQEKRRNETVSAGGLTIERAVRWIADLGGFTATGASKKPPGTTVIGRGLERVLDAEQLIQALRLSGRMR